jgi:hypothetical protein
VRGVCSRLPWGVVFPFRPSTALECEAASTATIVMSNVSLATVWIALTASFLLATHSTMEANLAPHLFFFFLKTSDPAA